MPRTARTPATIGWREWVGLPDLTDHPIKAKIDTGAATSSLHAHALKVVERDGISLARFEIHPHQDSADDAAVLELPIVTVKKVRPSTGRAQRRPVVRTTATMGDQTFPIDLTLTSRDAMGFRMLIGRAALRRRFVVDSGHSFLLGDHTP